VGGGLWGEKKRRIKSKRVGGFAFLIILFKAFAKEGKRKKKRKTVSEEGGKWVGGEFENNS